MRLHIILTTLGFIFLNVAHSDNVSDLYEKYVDGEHCICSRIQKLEASQKVVTNSGHPELPNIHQEVALPTISETQIPQAPIISEVSHVPDVHPITEIHKSEIPEIQAPEPVQVSTVINTPEISTIQNTEVQNDLIPQAQSGQGQHMTIIFKKNEPERSVVYPDENRKVTRNEEPTEEDRCKDFAGLLCPEEPEMKTSCESDVGSGVWRGTDGSGSQYINSELGSASHRVYGSDASSLISMQKPVGGFRTVSDSGIPSWEAGGSDGVHIRQGMVSSGRYGHSGAAWGAASAASAATASASSAAASGYRSSGGLAMAGGHRMGYAGLNGGYSGRGGYGRGVYGHGGYTHGGYGHGGYGGYGRGGFGRGHGGLRRFRH